MRLSMSQWWHGKSSSYGYESSGTSAEGSGQSRKHGRIEGSPGGIVARGDEHEVDGDRSIVGRGTGDGRAVAVQVPTKRETHPQRDKQRNWGGRRNALLTWAEEEEFLAPWLERARAGGVPVASPLRAALAEKLGQPVKASVVYRLLARHGWRKVAPDTRHPKSDPEAQAAWKKNSPKRWQPY
jgi:transposase